MNGYMRPVSGQRLGKHVPAATVTHSKGEKGCCLLGPRRGVLKKRIWATSLLSSAREVVSQLKVSRWDCGRHYPSTRDVLEPPFPLDSVPCHYCRCAFCSELHGSGHPWWQQQWQISPDCLTVAQLPARERIQLILIGVLPRLRNSDEKLHSWGRWT
jgi:hypothetical protein